MFLLLIQFVVPLLLLVALAVRTCSRATKALQAVAVFAYLLAVHLAGLWLELPWWTPWVYWALYAASLLVGARPKEAEPRAGRRGWLVPVVWGLAAVPIAGIAVTAVLARTPPPGPLSTSLQHFRPERLPDIWTAGPICRCRLPTSG